MKYLPSVFLRKRNNGDTQATMATRVWGVSSSARSLIFADGVPLTALIANNNTIGGPRWGLVAPSEIARIDMMYGPFSAAYAGNSMGAVMEITTRLPEKLEGSISQTQAVQTFDLYGTEQHLRHVADDRRRRRSVRQALDLGERQLPEQQQPAAELRDERVVPDRHDAAGSPRRTSSAPPANVLGASGLLHTGMTNAKVKAGVRHHARRCARRTRSATGRTTRTPASIRTSIARASRRSPARPASRAASTTLDAAAHGAQPLAPQRHEAHLGLRGRRHDVRLRQGPAAHADDARRRPATTFGAPGRVAVLDGTGWTTLDAKAIWRPSGKETSTHTVSVGAHTDRYVLQNTTFNTPDWTAGDFTTVATEGDGKTRTQAVWAQDAWRLTPTLRLTLRRPVRDLAGVRRLQRERHDDGRPADGVGARSSRRRACSRGTRRCSGRSRRRSARRTASRRRRSCISSCRPARRSRRRIPISSRTTCSRPSCGSSGSSDRALVQVALFQDDVHDAIISQFLPLVPGSTQLYSYLSNVDHVRSQGVELVLGSNDLFISRPRASGERDVHWREDARALGSRERDGARRARRSASSCRTSRSGARRSRPRIARMSSGSWP